MKTSTKKASIAPRGIGPMSSKNKPSRKFKDKLLNNDVKPYSVGRAHSTAKVQA